MITDPDKIVRLRTHLASVVWNEDILPRIANRGKEAIRALCLPLSERDGEFAKTEDPDLRAIIKEVNWMMTWMIMEVQVFDHNRQVDELDRQARQEPTANP